MQHLGSIGRRGQNSNDLLPNLVKIASHSKDKPSDMMNAGAQHTTMTEWIGADCPVDYLNVWFPAHWAPIVLRELRSREGAYRRTHKLWFDDPQDSDPPRVIDQRKDALRSRELHFHIGAMDGNKNLPTLIGKLKIDWLDFPVDDILQQFTTLKDGILRGVFKQQAARAWYGCRAEKAQVTVLLPGKCCFSKWTDMVDCMPHSWPKSFNIGRMQIVPIHAASFHKHRKFTRARHMWLRLEPNWRLLGSHMYTEWPGIHTYAEINDRLFVNPGRNDNIQDAKSKVRRYSPEYWQWMGQIEYMWQFLDGQMLPVQIKMEDTLAEYHDNLRKEQAEVALHRPAVKKQWKTKDGTFQVKQKQPVQKDQMDGTSPESEEATFSEMLRDVCGRMGKLFHCGEHLRGSESGNLERFTVSLTSISLFLGVCFGFCVVVWVLFVGFLCCFVFLVLFPPTMLRSSSCPPELTTVRAVMVRAAMEKKSSGHHSPIYDP